MRSGANYDEQYVVSHPDLLSAAFEEAFVENRMPFVGFTRAMTRRYPPGERYNYSTFETCVLGWVLERATKPARTVHDREIVEAGGDGVVRILDARRRG